MFKLFAFLTILAVALGAPAPAPGAVAILPSYEAYALPAALPVSTSSQSFIQNHNSLKLGYIYPSYSSYPGYRTYVSF